LVKFKGIGIFIFGFDSNFTFNENFIDIVYDSSFLAPFDGNNIFGNGPIDGSETEDETVSFGDGGGMFIFATFGVSEKIETSDDKVIIDDSFGKFELCAI
jgi:hypothetical protein